MPQTQDKLIRRRSSLESDDSNRNNRPRNGNDLINGSIWLPTFLWNGPPLRKELGRVTTPQELEMIAHTRESSHRDVLLAEPGDVDDESSSESSLSSSSDVRKDEDEILLVDGKQEVSVVRFSKRRRAILEEVDVEKYMARREMTVTQERWNALTMIPSPLYCLYFVLSGIWVTPDLVQEMREESTDAAIGGLRGFGGLANAFVGDSRGCLPPTYWHNIPALPPLPLLAVAAAITVHAPFSFLYHYKYAHSLPPGAPRTNHWSRRMDQAMIHLASALISYGTSGSWDFFVANVIYNADCIYRQFQRKVRPRRNKIRIMISVVAYTMPILRRGDIWLFFQIWSVFGFGFWLFGAYPIGGWSHAAFHLVVALAPPLLMVAACELPASLEQMKLAARCVLSNERGGGLA